DWRIRTSFPMTRRRRARPTRLYATLMTGENVEIDFSTIEVPELNHDAVRIAIPKPICPGLHLADHPPRYGEALFFFGDANGAGVMCAEVGTVIALGPLEFEHTADIMRGMSGGPVVDADCRLVGLCEKGRKTTARKNGVELPGDSRFLKTRRFATTLHNVTWRR
ncbi:MAG: trypsin-like peptidase domain-containing protein, partial [Kiritimatiellia bacterium]